MPPGDHWLDLLFIERSGAVIIMNELGGFVNSFSMTGSSPIGFSLAPDFSKIYYSHGTPTSPTRQIFSRTMSSTTSGFILGAHTVHYSGVCGRIRNDTDGGFIVSGAHAGFVGNPDWAGSAYVDSLGNVNHSGISSVHTPDGGISVGPVVPHWSVGGLIYAFGLGSQFSTDPCGSCRSSGSAIFVYPALYTLDLISGAPPYVLAWDDHLWDGGAGCSSCVGISRLVSNLDSGQFTDGLMYTNLTVENIGTDGTGRTIEVAGINPTGGIVNRTLAATLDSLGNIGDPAFFSAGGAAGMCQSYLYPDRMYIVAFDGKIYQRTFPYTQSTDGPIFNIGGNPSNVCVRCYRVWNPAFPPPPSGPLYQGLERVNSDTSIQFGKYDGF